MADRPTGRQADRQTSRQTHKKIDFRNNSNGYLFSFEIMAQAAYWKLNCAEVHVECDYHQDHTSHGYAGATVYAMLHFVTLAQFLFSTWTRGEVGVFKKSKS